jgi:hypothetical protein
VTGVAGGAITYCYQDRAEQKQQDARDLATARESAVTFLREFSDILERRKYLAYRCIHGIEDRKPAGETEELWKAYMDAVTAWNLKWNLYRAPILKELGPELGKRFYDPVVDDVGDSPQKCSITDKLIILHRRLSTAHESIRSSLRRIARFAAKIFETVEMAVQSESLARVEVFRRSPRPRRACEPIHFAESGVLLLLAADERVDAAGVMVPRP